MTDYRALHAAHAPPGFQALRERALDGLEFPLRRDEAWRFTSAAKLLKAEHTPSASAFAGPVSANGLEDHVGTVAGLDGFAGLNAAFFTELAGLRLTGGETETLELVHTGLSAPRIVIVAEPGADATVVLHHTVREGLAVPVVELVGRGAATLVHVVEGEGHFAGRVAVRAEGHVALHSILAGCAIARLDVPVTLERGGRFDAAGLVLGKGREHADHHLDIRHAGADAVSSQLFRNILDDRARAVFTGLVRVEKHITGSDATQSANTLLLSDHASAVARPWLEIDNDDVTASHGATVGRLDPDALFYLRSRGIGRLDARRLLTRAFAGEVVEGLPEVARERVAGLVERWLEGRVA